MVGYYGFYNKQIRRDYLGYCIGSISGAIAMFSHPVYHVILDNEDGYRAVAAGGLIARMKENYLSAIFQEGFFNNLFLNTLFLAVCFILFLQYPKKKFKHLSLKYVVELGLLVMCVFWCCSLYLLIKYGYAYANSFTGHQRAIVGLFTFFSLIYAIMCSMILSSTEKVDYLLLNLWASFVIMIAPLFAVTPIGSRCFFGSYIIMIMIVCRLLGCVEWKPQKKEYRCAKMAAVVVIAILFIRYSYIYGRNYVEDNKRIDYVLESVENGEESITIPRLPYENYLWVGSPENEYSEAMFKRFYKIPENVRIIVQ